MLSKVTFLFWLILSSQFLFSDCDFNHSNHISALNSPGSINSIEIIVPKSKAYVKNFIQILLNKSENIPPNLRKNFNATVKAHYKFGTCTFNAKIRQHGDWKDHIDFEKGEPNRSLKVRLLDGNILNAVDFKLLIPKTRNGVKEIFGILLMRNLGFIAPETFLVNAKVNNVSSTFLFQESIRKEALERNLRREGPIFEGDEALLWSFEDYKPLELLPLSLSRVSNNKWFEKGDSSKDITLNAFNKLQQAYLRFSSNVSFHKKVIINPNENKELFQSYFLYLLALDASHGLISHNRNYYYNSFEDSFEPIYYDGMVEIPKYFFIDKLLLQRAFDKEFIQNFENNIGNLDINSITKDFESRTMMSKSQAKDFTNEYFSRFNNNLNELINSLNEITYETIIYDNKSKLMTDYLNKTKNYEIDQKIAISIVKEDKYFKVHFIDGSNKIISDSELTDLVSNNQINGSRAVYVPDNNLQINNHMQFTSLEGFSTPIIHSKGIDFKISNNERILIINQTNPQDWVLFRDMEIQEWKIVFNGLKPVNTDNSSQRFNSFGLTGCLNFYKVHFLDVKIETSLSHCEDSLNIISSKGKINSMKVDRAFSDAIDIDFSQINISNINVNSAFNDCVDVSSGNYVIENLILINCGDKAISIGEKSNMDINSISVGNANIGISSKDLSITNIFEANLDVEIFCLESKQKKQEFGGSILNIENISCDGKYNNDNKSQINIINEF